MNFQRRKIILAALALPAGCAIQPLKTMVLEPIASPQRLPAVRAAALGQSWVYRRLNVYNSELLAIEREEVTTIGPRIVIQRRNGAGQVLPEEHHLDWGQVVREPVWDFVQNYEAPVPHWPALLKPGATEKVYTHYAIDNFSPRYALDVWVTAKTWERIKLPIGTFDVLRIEKFIRIQHYDEARKNAFRRDTIWLAPEIGRWVARETSGEYQILATKTHVDHEPAYRWELSAWS